MKTTVSKAKRVITYDKNGKENGWLMELYKDGEKTLAYLTAAKPGAFKGYHLHRVRASRYVCIRGGLKVILYTNIQGNYCVFTNTWERREYFLNEGDTLFIPTGTPTGIENITDSEAWLVNWPDPAYDPNLKDEQVEYTEEELTEGIVK